MLLLGDSETLIYTIWIFLKVIVHVFLINISLFLNIKNLERTTHTLFIIFNQILKSHKCLVLDDMKKNCRGF